MCNPGKNDREREGESESVVIFFQRITSVSNLQVCVFYSWSTPFSPSLVENQNYYQSRSFLIPPNPLLLVSSELLSIVALILANFSVMTCNYVKVQVPFVMDDIEVGFMFRQQIQCDVNLFASEAYYCTINEQCQSYLEESADGSEYLSFYEGHDASAWRSGRALAFTSLAIGLVGVVTIMLSTTVMSLPFLQQKHVFHILAALYLICAVLIANASSVVMLLTQICDKYQCTLSRGAYCAILASISWLVASIGCVLCIPPKEQPLSSSSNNSVSSSSNDSGSPDGDSYSPGATTTTADNCSTITIITLQFL